MKNNLQKTLSMATEMNKSIIIAVATIMYTFTIQAQQTQLKTGDTFEYTNTNGVLKTYTVVGENLIENPSFENNTTGWVGGGGGSLTGVDWHSNGGVDDGAYLRLTENAGKGGNGSIGTAWSLEKGKTYVFSYFARLNTDVNAVAKEGYIITSETNTPRGDESKTIMYGYEDANCAWTQNIVVTTAEFDYLQFCARWLSGRVCFDAFILAEVSEVADPAELEALLANCQEWLDTFADEAKGLDAFEPAMKEAQDLVDGEEYTAEELNAMVHKLNEALLDFRMANASDEYTVDVTNRYLTNPNFDNSLLGWTRNNDAINNGSNIRFFEYFGEPSRVLEINGNPNKDTYVSQTVYNLPLGHYRFTVQCVMNHSVDTTDPEAKSGAAIYCNSSELDMVTNQITTEGASKDNSYPQTFTVEGYVSNYLVTVGIAGYQNSDFTYVAIDNVKLEYVGPTSSDSMILIDDIYYNITSTKNLTVEVKACPNNSREMTIPTNVVYNDKTYRVTSIGSAAFYNCSSLTSITIPEGVTSIGGSAFYNCSSLTSITIPESVTSIGDYAFDGCSSLTSITIPESVTSIGGSAFYNCSSLTSITIPEGVTSIGGSTFYNCSSLTSITIPEGVTSIGGSAFYNCGSLRKVINLSDLDIESGSSSHGFVAYCAEKVITPDDAIDKYYFYTSKESTHYLVGYYGNDSILNLPEDYHGNDYIIDAYAFTGDARIVSVNIPQTVGKIGSSAFARCSKLAFVTIPRGVMSIGNNAFENCTSLAAIVIPQNMLAIGSKSFAGCSNLASVEFKEGVETIGNNAFANCTSLTTVFFPESLTEIGSKAFYDCNNLVDIHIQSIEAWLKISYEDFFAHPNNSGKDIKLYLDGESLTEVKVPTTVTSIPYYAFGHCSSLTSITIPEGVTSIGDYAFDGCSSLNSITIPNSVTSIGNKAFYGCKFNPILLNCHLTGVGDFGWDDTSVIYLYKNDYNRVKANNGGTYYILEDAYRVDITNTYMKGFTFEVIKDNDFPLSNELKHIMVNDIELEINSEGIYQIKDLKTNTSYTVSLTYLTDDSQEVKLEHIIETSKPEIDFSYTTTNTTIEIPTLTASSDITNPVGETGISIKTSDYKTSTYTYTGSPITIKNLKPNKEYTIYSYAYYGEEKVSGKSYKITTQSLTPQIEMLDITPTSFTAKGKYANIDATVNETGFTDYDASELLTLTGLDPSTKYTIEYYVKTKEGSNEKVTTTFTTPALEMTTLNPKVVSNSCAIVAATTNMSDEETNAGFQWRKYEAPETLPSSEGYAAIYDGQLEGYIKNLQSTSFYNVRAFYKSTAGKYYYSDWVTFDPSDFSYFEPTVHTYPTEELTANSAKMKGYVLQGTDAIIEQGFVYWPTGTNKANATRSVTVPENASIVIAKGQVMNVTLEGLTPSTTYSFCAFVTTASGTIYGEEHSFTTKADETGIELIESEQTAPSIIGYYDLNGHKLSEPQHGITIVRYSDGTTCKILRK